METSVPEKDPVDRMLAVFENAGPETIARVDARIAETTEQLARLKRMRAAMAKTVGGYSPKNRQASGRVDPELEASIVSLVGDGPLKPKVIGDRLGKHHVAIGTCVARSDKLTKDADGRVMIG